MVVIRGLDENGNLVEPSTLVKRITLWNYCYRNTRCPDGTVDCKLVELGMFGGCESSLNSKSDNTYGSDSDSSFPSVFTRSRMTMAIFHYDPKYVRVVRPVYTYDKHLASLSEKLTFSSSSDEEEVVLEVCYVEEQTHISVSKSSFTLSFYFYIPTI